MPTSFVISFSLPFPLNRNKVDKTLERDRTLFLNNIFSFSFRQHGTGIWRLNVETGSLDQVVTRIHRAGGDRDP